MTMKTIYSNNPHNNRNHKNAISSCYNTIIYPSDIILLEETFYIKRPPTCRMETENKLLSTKSLWFGACFMNVFYINKTITQSKHIKYIKIKHSYEVHFTIYPIYFGGSICIV